jgi:hypothetical protein
MRVLEEPDGCVGDVGCGGVAAELRAGATTISEAGDPDVERLESCERVR